MKYMLMMHAPGATGEYQFSSWAPEDLQAHIRFMHDLNADLSRAGEFVAGEGLAAPGDAKLVRSGGHGEPVTDGPFAESKEFLAGFWIVDVESEDRACEIAARISAAPGPGGEPIIIPVEVRQVMGPPPVDA